MYKIKVYTIGKTKEDWLQKGLEEYEGRLKSSLSFEWILAKNDSHLMQLLEKDINRIFDIIKTKTYLDAGFMVIDNNQKIIINSQNAFDIYSVQQKRFNVINI